MASPILPPSPLPFTPSAIHFPPSQGHYIHLSTINTSSSNMLSSILLSPAPSSPTHLPLAGYTFILHSPHHAQTVLFDLGFMHNAPQRMPPGLRAALFGTTSPDSASAPSSCDRAPAPAPTAALSISTIADVPSTLLRHGTPLHTVDAIIWSHTHVDHTGDPAAFPSHTRLLLGPGGRAACGAGWPEDEKSGVLSSAFAGGRAVVELDFAPDDEGGSTTTIGGFRALDFWGDGSFFVLSMPGHTRDHLGGLVRTGEAEWVLMAGDAAHWVGQVRPSAWRVLPEDGARARATPFAGLSPVITEDMEMARETLAKLQAFDGRDEVFMVLAHDSSLVDVIELFPERMNGWREKGWGEKGRWRFLHGMEKDGMVRGCCEC